jgi:hypothetical protein
MLAVLTALPMWVKVGAGMGLLMGIMWVSNWWNTRDLKRDLAKQEQLLKQTQEDAAKAEAQRQLHAAQEEQNRLELESQISQQNARISAAAARARQAETAAALATMRAIKDGQDAADALRDPSTKVPVGYEAMNDWTRQRFGGVK